MSWRLNIAPAMPNSENADWTILPGASPEDVDAVADACQWHGLRVFAPAADDWRLLRLMQRLEVERGVPPDAYNVFIRDDREVQRGGWVEL